MADSIKGFITDDGSVAQYDFNSLHGIPEVLKTVPSGKVGQILEVTSVDEQGNITGVKAVDKPTSSEGSGENVDLTGYAKETWVQEGFQPKGNYLTKAPVTTVNGKTGVVNLSASDVGARSDTWVPTAQEVGADPTGTAASAVGTHNTDGDAHNDIRLEVKAIRDQLSAFLDVDEETLNELSELIARIVANQTSIGQLTTGKVNVTDIVNNLTTNATNKPLSAAQGVALKTLIDAIIIPTKLSQLANDKGYLTQHQDISGKVDKASLTLGVHEDGLIYVFVDGQPVGNGVELPTGGINGYVTPDNKIIIQGLPDGSYTAAYEYENGSIVNIGNLVVDTNVYYTITNTLTNCTNSNSATQVIEGENYSATITAKSGYELKSVTVTMGGSPVTVSGGTISIANVTGNIVITAVAEEIKASYTNLATKFQIGKRYNSSGAIVDQADACVVEDYIPFTIGTVVRIKGFGVMDKYTCPLYMSDKTTVNTAGKVNALSSHMDYSYDSTSKVVTITAKNTNNAWIRIAGVLTGTTADVIITVNEEIV